MENRKSYAYILIGLAVRLLRNVKSDNPVEYVIRHIDMLTEQLETVGFNVSLAGAVDLHGIVEDLNELEDETTPVGQDMVARLDREMDLLERVIFSEASVISIYTLPERRYNSESLLNEPQNILKSGVFEKMSDIAKFDISSGCRCILFGEATAAAFHILRATEDTLTQYYHHHKRQNRLPKPMWGPMTVELRNKKRNKPPNLVLDTLDLVRVSYRNPTQHPKAKYDIDGVQDLFGVCVDLINKMADEL